MARKGPFVRTGIEIAERTADFEADDEGSMPFTRSNLRQFGSREIGCNLLTPCAL
jgi:hypothetical protein